MKQVFMRHLRFPPFARGSTSVQLPLAKNEIQLDFSKSPQRVGLPTFLNLHLFLHAGGLLRERSFSVIIYCFVTAPHCIIDIIATVHLRRSSAAPAYGGIEINIQRCHLG